MNVFSSVAFAGNPTCVCFVPPEIAEARTPVPAAAAATAWMSKVARELAQPTTSFVEPVAGRFRTFSSSGDELPTLSGHSSLGIAAAMSARTGATSHILTSPYGTVTLSCERDTQLCELTLPSSPPPLVSPTAIAPLLDALGVPAADQKHSVVAHGLVLGGKFAFVELTPDALGKVAPRAEAIRALPCLGLIAMAAGLVEEHETGGGGGGGYTSGYTPDCLSGEGSARPERIDFTCRNFVPKLGIEEDIATGSIHAALNPYWRDKLGRGRAEALRCLQASRRGGFVSSVGGDDGRVRVSGHAAFAFSGSVPCGDWH